MWLRAILFIAIMQCGVAHAHVRSESFSQWQFDKQILRVTFTVSAREATRIPHAIGLVPLNFTVARYLDDRVNVHARPGDCQLSRSFTPTRSRPGFVQVEAQWRCDVIPESLQVRAFFDLAPEHAHFATLRTAGHLEQRLFTETNPVWPLKFGDSAQRESANSSTRLSPYLKLGITHIATGYDHVAFLLALLLVCRKSKDIVLAVSGFTVGHSITLALGVLGIVRPNTLAIEGTIGLTIALVAMERGSRNDRSALELAILTGLMLSAMAVLSINQLGQLSVRILAGLAVFSFCYILLSHDVRGRGSLRVLTTVLFGLVHGLGFAGAFIDNELPPELLAPLLLGFNIGVEIGQLALIALVLAMFFLLRRRYSPRTLYGLNDVFAAGLCGLGIFLLIHRTYGSVIAG